ncbi:hypothetical protein MATL_G00225060 [Megalops atlanticus]|uniref:Lipocalin/cytosolic fatty-acid binding domain-containing protein n=1 Tax=Megalops atlanticus TaxID=7932 RepID=A0A9D3PIQ5_MEGAT|nr:hypothetical protein MATL_G00225060 [Megalops atlanticus]
MCALYTVAVLSLLSAAAAAPVPCEELVKPLVLDNVDKILGKWILIAGTADDPNNVDVLRNIDSAWLQFSLASHNDTAIFTQGVRLGKECIYSSAKTTIKNNKFTINDTIVSTGVLLRADPDYLLMSYSNTFGQITFQFLYLLGKKADLSVSELELYKRQVKCLSLHPPVLMDKEKELCPKKREPSQIKELKGEKEGQESY